MMIKTFRRASVAVGLLGMFVALLSGCGGGSGSSVVVTPPGTRAACQANAAHNDGRARWTVLVYMNGSNNLQPFSLLNVAQMASVGSDSNVNIVLQWKQTAQSEVSNCGDCVPSFVGTRRYLLRQHNTASLCTDLTDFSTCSTSEPTVLAGDRVADPSTNVLKLNPDTNQTVSTSDMGDYHVLANFVQWGLQNYPADNYALVLWDHGSGWRPVYRSAARRPVTRAVSQDDDTGNEIETWEMDTALTSLPHPLDMIVIDCSLEDMAEVAYQLRNDARVMVGSEESPPGAGYPYQKWLAGLKTSGKNPCDLGNTIVQTFVANYPNETNVTQAVLDLSKMNNVAQNVNAFGTALYNDRTTEATLIQNSRNLNNVQSYGINESNLYAGFVDLYNYTQNIKAGTTVTAVSQAATNVQTALTDPTNGVVITNGVGQSQAGSHGLAIYVPDPGIFTGSLVTSYKSLAFASAAPQWPQFLQAQTK